MINAITAAEQIQREQQITALAAEKRITRDKAARILAQQNNW